MKGIPRALGKQHVWRKGHWTGKKRILLGYRSALWPLKPCQISVHLRNNLTQVIHHNDLCLTQVTEMCPANCETKCVYLNLITFTEKFWFKTQTFKQKKNKIHKKPNQPEISLLHQTRHVILLQATNIKPSLPRQEQSFYIYFYSSPPLLHSNNTAHFVRTRRWEKSWDPQKIE